MRRYELPERCWRRLEPLLPHPTHHHHALGVSRGGFGTKAHLVCTARGLLLGVFLTPGQRQESRAFAPTMGAVLTARGRPRRWPAHLAGDKGYSFPGVRRWLRRRRIG